MSMAAMVTVAADVFSYSSQLHVEQAFRTLFCGFRVRV